MTESSDFKKRVRTRMARTGESYAAARAQIFRSGRERTPAGPSELGAAARMNKAAADVVKKATLE